MTDATQHKAETLAVRFHARLPGPPEKFSLFGRKTLACMIQLGMLPEHRVLDIGCGPGRAGHWLVRYLNAGNYHGCEPLLESEEMAGEFIGRRHEYCYYTLSSHDIDELHASPNHRDYNIILARSIWTHCSQDQLAKTLNIFAGQTEPVFLVASYHRALNGEQYQGEGWQSDRCIRHCPKWIKEECKRRNLDCEFCDHLDWGGGQQWLLVKPK